MRLMIGNYNEPSLLVTVEGVYTPTKFDFYVINGAWSGTFDNGYITIDGWTGASRSKMKAEILSDNQDRLRCDDTNYNDVFDNFHNPDYVGPVRVKYKPKEYEDDVPF